MSGGHLSREFRRAYGESPYSSLMIRRISRRCSIGSSVNGMAGQVCSRQPAKPCRAPAYDCCDAEDPAN